LTRFYPAEGSRPALACLDGASAAKLFIIKALQATGNAGATMIGLCGAASGITA
jgi:hypothetical protein